MNNIELSMKTPTTETNQYDIEANYKEKDVKWNREDETILKEWADKAACYKWLHLKCHEIYKQKNAFFSISVIIISTITGTANFAQDRIPMHYLNLFVMLIGGLNIIVGILSTIYQYLKIAELNESHRVASIAWDKFSRNIKIELTKHPDDRMNIKQMFKMSKNEYDRLEETSPQILEVVIGMFKKQFPTTDSDNLIKPDILGTITGATIFKNEINNLNYNDMLNTIKEKNKLEIETKELKIKNKIEDVQIYYLNNKGRMPTDSEIEEFEN